MVFLSAIDDGLLFGQFLDCHGFNKTAESFKEEVSSLGFTLAEQRKFTKDRIKQADVLRLFGGCESCDYESFFKDWEGVVPDNVKTKSAYKKLTIFLYTYFATKSFGLEEAGFLASDENDNVCMECDVLPEDEPIQETKVEQITATVNIVDKSLGLDQLTKLSGTFIVEKPFRLNVPQIEDSEPPVRRESKDFEVDSLEDAGDRRNSVFTVTADDNSAMNAFKKFLSEHGAEFASEPEFLPYFALPFVENPKEHPTFTEVFEQSWIENLKSTLASFLVEHSCGESAIPDLVNMCRDRAVSKEVAQNKSGFEEKRIFKEFKRKTHKLKRDHQKLVGVTNELASALEKSVQGDAVDLKTTLMKCSSIYPELFPTHLPPHHKKWHSPDRHNLSEKSHKLSPSSLNVKRIKQDLREGSVKAQLLLLQALRWMLTKCNYNERDDIAGWFCKHDILGVRDGAIKELLAPVSTPHPIQQAIVRIMNALSSLSAGRKYIESSENTVALLLNLTKQQELDPVTEDMVIAVLQKMSIRKERCEQFTQQGIIEWILGKLERLPQKVFTLEYSTSLLMNLVLSVPPQYWDSNETIANVLMNLMFSTHRQALEFVCGTLCCVLRNDFVNDYCRSQGLGPKLSTTQSNYKDDPLIEKQIETLIKIHRREIEPETFVSCIATYSDDDMDDPEDLDPEIDELDPVKGSPNGTDLLQLQYWLIFNVPRINRSPSRLQTIPASPMAILPSWAQYK